MTEDARSPEPAGPLAEAMLGYLDGDPRAFADLHQRLAPPLRALLRRLTGDPETAQDLLQVTLMKAHLARDRFAFPGAPSDRAVLAWYLAIARNSALDHLRRCPPPARDLHADLPPLEDLPDPELGFEDALISRQEEASVIERVHAAIAALPPALRDVVLLHKLRGMSMAEVATRLSIREGAARVRAHRAYRALASWLVPALSCVLLGGGWQR